MNTVGVIMEVEGNLLHEGRFILDFDQIGFLQFGGDDPLQELVGAHGYMTGVFEIVEGIIAVRGRNLTRMTKETKKGEEKEKEKKNNRQQQTVSR